MAVDIIEVYRLLPKIDCRQCPARSCMAFAKAVSEDPEKLSECVRITTNGLMMIEALLCEGQ